MHLWANFWFVALIQFVVFLFLARKRRLSTRRIFSLLCLCLSGGLIFGFLFDLIVGRYFGVFSYQLPSSALFYLTNDALSYGLAMAAVALFPRDIRRFWVWSVIVALICELANFLFPVWVWDFLRTQWLAEVVIILFGYSTLFFLMRLFYRLVLTLRSYVQR